MSSIDADQLLPEASQSFATHIIGPAFAGWQAQLFFQGVLTCYAWYYFKSAAHKRDSRSTKAWFYAVVLLSYGQAGITYYSVMVYGTRQARDSTTLYGQTAADAMQTFFVGFEGALVQMFLARRVAVVIHTPLFRYLYLAFVSITAFSGLVGAMLYLALSWVLKLSDGSTQQIGSLTFNAAAGMWLWSCAFTDVFITFSLTIALRKRIAGFNSSTDSVLRKLIFVAVETASYTAVFALLGATLCFAFPDASLNANVSTAFWLCLSPFYALSLVRTLRSREEIADSANSVRVITPSFVDPDRINTFSRASRQSGGAIGTFATVGSHQPSGVRMTQEVTIAVDECQSMISTSEKAISP